jgi:hypothetical protein
MQSASLSRSHVVVACVFIFSVLGPSCNIKGFKEKPYPTPWVIVTTPDGVQQEDITLTYQLIEVDGTGSDISLEFSTDGGQTWNPATAKGGDGTTNVKGFYFPGMTRTIVWDSFEDGISETHTCKVKITAAKSESGIIGTPDETGNFEIQNPDFPAISWIVKPEGHVRQVSLTFTWKLDTSAILIGNYFYGLDEDPPTSTTTSTSVTIPAPSLGPHVFRVYACSKTNLNSSVLTASFNCDNSAANIPPSVVILDGPSGTTYDNTPTFEYVGADPDGSVTGYYVSIDESLPTFWTTETTWTSPELNCGSHTFYVIAQDNEGANSALLSRDFTFEKPVENGSNWNTIGRNNQHTAYVPETDLKFPMTVQWENQFTDMGPLRPCAEAGNVFYALYKYSGMGGLISFRLSDGHQNWFLFLDETEFFHLSYPAVFDGKVYFQYVKFNPKDHRILCLDSAYGTVLWNSHWGGQWDSYEAPCVENGQLYIGGGGYGGLYSFDIANGNQNWFVDLPQYDRTTPCLWQFPEDSSAICAVRLSDGDLLWSLPDSSTFRTAEPCSAASGVLITPNPVAAWDITAKSIKWEKSYFSYTPAIAEGYVYAANHYGLELQKIDLDNGSVAWTYPIPARATAQVVVTKNHVIVPTEKSTHFVNLETGLESWSCP